MRSRILTESPIVPSHGILISGRNSIRLARARFGSAVTLQLQFDAIDRAEHLPVHLFYHRRIAWKPAGIELLHLPRQFLHLFHRLLIALNHLPQLVQLAHALLIGPLRICRITGRVKRRRPLLPGLTIAIVTSIDIAPHSPVRITAATVPDVTALGAVRTRPISRLLAEAAADLRCAATPLCAPALCTLTRLLPRTTLLSTIAGLLSIAHGLPLLISILTSLSVLRLLPVLALLSIAALPALAVLPLLSAITTPRRRHRLKLTTQSLHLAQRGRLITLPLATFTGFALADSLLCLPKLLAKLL